MSNRLTFSLASLVLIFAMVFSAMPVLAHIDSTETGHAEADEASHEPHAVLKETKAPMYVNAMDAFEVEFMFEAADEDNEVTAPTATTFVAENIGVVGADWAVSSVSMTGGKYKVMIRPDNDAATDPGAITVVAALAFTPATLTAPTVMLDADAPTIEAAMIEVKMPLMSNGRRAAPPENGHWGAMGKSFDLIFMASDDSDSDVEGLQGSGVDYSTSMFSAKPNVLDFEDGGEYGDAKYAVTVTPKDDMDVAAGDEVVISITIKDKVGNEIEMPAMKTIMLAKQTAGATTEGTDPTEIERDNIDSETEFVPSGMLKPDSFMVFSPMKDMPIKGAMMIEKFPNLQRFFARGGTISLVGPDGTKAKDVVISEIMWGLNEAAVVANQPNYQWIEVYNTNNALSDTDDTNDDPAAIDLSDFELVFTPGNVLPSPANLSDQVSNIVRAGWDVDIGQSGSLRPADDTGTPNIDESAKVTPKNLISMYRNINYTDLTKKHGDKNAADNRTEQLKAVPDGKAKGSWMASTVNDTFATNQLGSPGMKHFVGRSATAFGATSVARSPLIITEVGNLTGTAHDWIELTALANVNLEKYELQYVKGSEKKIVVLAQFVKKELKAGEILLVLGTDPATAGHPVAAGKEWKLGDADRTNTGTNSLYHVDAKMMLPDDIGKATFIVRNEKGKTNHENIIDLAGNAYHTDNSDAFRTNLWPLRATSAGHGNVIKDQDEHFNSPRAYQRDNRGGGTGENHWTLRGYTGVGYDRRAATGGSPGTPGFDNGSVKEKSTDLTDATVTISEVMYERTGNTPQWIELYNSSKTQGINLNEWKLRIENPREDTDVDIRSRPTIQFGGVHIPPLQTVLIVSAATGTHSGQFPAQRVIDLWKEKRSDLEVADIGRNYQLLSTSAFKLTLIEKGGTTVDMAGNLGAENAWDLPVSEDGRGSIIRNYKATKQALDGTWKGGWHHASDEIRNPAPQHVYYGRRSDMGTPGFRVSGPLPVSLSKFRPERLDDGTIVVRWITESELNNAGFNILRSEKRDGEFTKLNTKLIAGQGTTSERTTYTYPDTSAKPNVVYYYQIQDVSLEGQVTTLRTTHLRGNVSAAGKLTTTWGELKALQ
ncbi:MAG: lamin tail domain-containing protein [Candidatus Poribacteria bacterium]|nr:lamin tail domain-containing protein [Candidatus Poribacteria bacterium]